MPSYQRHALMEDRSGLVVADLTKLEHVVGLGEQRVPEEEVRSGLTRNIRSRSLSLP